MVKPSTARAKIARLEITTTVIASRIFQRLVLRGDGREAGRQGDSSFVIAGSCLIMREEMWSDDARADVLPFLDILAKK